jgi:glycosyltransferase involved in cell wall biosynthesis
VGDGADREEIKAQGAASPHANRIHFEGFHPHPQVYFRSADIFVLASHRESFGLVVLEARNEGCAIVATSVDGIPEALERGKAGILVPPFDSASLANALRTMLSSEETRRMWSARAKEGIEAFKIPRMIEELRTVYDELLADNCAVQKQT